jgi:hypothetical protein
MEMQQEKNPPVEIEIVSITKKEAQHPRDGELLKL